MPAAASLSSPAIAGGPRRSRARARIFAISPACTSRPQLKSPPIRDGFAGADLVILAAPAQATRALATTLAPKIPPAFRWSPAAKGIEQATGKTQTAIISEVLPGNSPAALSGPGFAEEIARGLPTAVTMAAKNLDLAHALSAALATDTFRPYASDDLIGVELGGAVKNVLAIAAGIVAARGLGESARAALIARGLAEMMRLGAALGARAETFMGLSGLGDLVLTATSRHSRNLAFGMALGEGPQPGRDLLGAGQPLAEGAYTAAVAAELARRHGVDMPITAAVAAIVAGRDRRRRRDRGPCQPAAQGRIGLNRRLPRHSLLSRRPVSPSRRALRTAAGRR